MIHSRLYSNPSSQKLHVLVVVASTEYDKNLFCCLNFKLPSCSISKSRFSFLEVHKNADWFKSNKPFHYGLAIYTFSHNMCCNSWSLNHCKSRRKLLNKWCYQNTFIYIFMTVWIFTYISILRLIEVWRPKWRLRKRLRVKPYKAITKKSVTVLKPDTK